MEKILLKYAVLCGSAPDDFRQKKIVEMHTFLSSKDGGAFSEPNIVIFPNGVDELNFEFLLNNITEAEPEFILLYFCPQEAVNEGEKSVWLSNNEIRKSVIDYYITNFPEIKFQVLYDSCRDFVSEESLGYEKLV